MRIRRERERKNETNSFTSSCSEYYRLLLFFRVNFSSCLQFCIIIISSGIIATSILFFVVALSSQCVAVVVVVVIIVMVLLFAD